MVDSLDIAIALHNICLNSLVPKGIAPPHGIDSHSIVCALYANHLNKAGLDVTGKQVAEVIIGAVMWSSNSPWFGHPHPDIMVKILQ